MAEPTRTPPPPPPPPSGDAPSPDARAPAEDQLPWLEELPPRKIVAELDRYIVGQEVAKKAVAIDPQPLAPLPGAGGHPRRDPSQQHHHDRAHGGGEDRDRAPARAPRRRAVPQGRGVEVHRGRLRGARRRVDGARARRRG